MGQLQLTAHPDYCSSLHHFGHECWQALDLAIVCPHSCKYCIHQRHLCLITRHKAANLSKKCHYAHWTDVSALATHVGTRDDQESTLPCNSGTGTNSNTQHHRNLLQPETRSSVRIKFSVSNEDLQDLKFSQCIVEDSGLQGCEIVLLGVSWCSAGTWGLHGEQIYRSVDQHGLDNQGRRWTGHGYIWRPCIGPYLDVW